MDGEAGSGEVTAVLEIDGVSKTFAAVRALDRCTFTAAPKRMTGLLGPNGAGKTTVLRCLLGLVEPDGGTLRWRGAPVTDEVRHRFGYMPEERGLYPSIRVGEQVGWVTAGFLFPPTAPMFMPLRAGLVDVPEWQMLVAVALMALAIFGTVNVGGRLYRGAVLHTAGRLRLRQAWHRAR